MYLQKIHIENYRLLTNIDIFLDRVLTLIVGKNNTGKTSVINLIRKVLNLAFLQKYLKLSYCDLYFCDKAILVEGATERFLSKTQIHLFRTPLTKSALKSADFCFIRTF